jgi:hypothetical protein
MLAIEHVLAPATIDRALAASEAEPAPPPRLATA